MIWDSVIVTAPKIAGDWTFCIWWHVFLVAWLWWMGILLSYLVFTEVGYNHAGVTLRVMFTLCWTGLWWEGPSSQLPFQEAPTSNIFERNLEKAHFPSPPATERSYFFFPHNEEASEKPWNMIEPLIKHTGLKLFKKRHLPKAFSVQMSRPYPDFEFSTNFKQPIYWKQ